MPNYSYQPEECKALIRKNRKQLKTNEMKKNYLIIIIIAGLTITSGRVLSQSSDETIQLFNGKNLDNWEFYLQDNAVDPKGVFYIQDGVIHIKGDPFGYMRTKEVYSDYVLHVEWRYPVEATNSGIFVNVQSPDSIWPACFEIQLRAGSAGDFVLMSGTSLAEKTDRIIVAKKNESNEKPVGEWNTAEIKVAGGNIEVVINGLLQNKGTKASHTCGHICLQSEGKDIEFRNVHLTSLK